LHGKNREKKRTENWQKLVEQGEYGSHRGTAKRELSEDKTLGGGRGPVVNPEWGEEMKKPKKKKKKQTKKKKKKKKTKKHLMEGDIFKNPYNGMRNLK